ncbi:hypothetical protein [Mesorhizobium sp. M7A.F.Ca.MR.245.00.0.0]|uniref:hypothetical protein n=1 Tax=Mesorhizobium sp. M7A.F.Ca.MR.245.00.0.0 TaxID=2496778 RepID=UPI0013E35240|nr:hypothetical protein [Mesorhizobium sp. M7A.F.Ca.MR.245.00.0.0]
MSGEERRVIGLSPEDAAAISTGEQARVPPHGKNRQGTAAGHGPSHTWPIRPIFNRCRVFLYEVLERALSALVHIVSAVGVDVQRKANASRVAKGQELEVEHLVEVTEIDPRQARTLLRKHGADWPKLKDEAEALKKED